MVSFLKQLAWSILHVISPVWIKEAHKYNILNKHKMKEYLTLNWSQGVASSHKDEEIASRAEILSPGYAVFWY